MEHFTYFSDIEEHYQRRRGSILPTSPVDWCLMETWKEAGIPLEAVLRGIDAAFDKWERRAKKTRKVNSLAYCQQEVLAAVEDLQEAALGSTRDPSATSIANADLARYFERNAQQMEKTQHPAAAVRALVGGAGGDAAGAGGGAGACPAQANYGLECRANARRRMWATL